MKYEIIDGNTGEVAIQLTLFDYQQMDAQELDKRIRRGIETFMDVGMSLMVMRDRKKYKELGYMNFEEYTHSVGMERAHGYRLIDAGYITNILSPIGDKMPTHESQVRPLTRLGTSKKPAPDLWIKAWNDACEKSGDEPPTEKIVKEVVDNMLWEEPPPLPDGVYRIIYADPPWKYQEFGVSISQYYGGQERHYKRLDIEDFEKLPVKDLASDNSVLFLWVTSPKLNQVWGIIEAWGFEYKTSFIWDKVKHNYGYYNSVRHEILLICGRGSSTPDIPKLYDSVQTIERTEKHSEKPEEFRKIIDELYPTGKRIELFARTKIDGWDSWGNEELEEEEQDDE